MLELFKSPFSFSYKLNLTTIYKGNFLMEQSRIIRYIINCGATIKKKHIFDKKTLTTCYVSWVLAADIFNSNQASLEVKKNNEGN